MRKSIKIVLLGLALVLVLGAGLLIFGYFKGSALLQKDQQLVEDLQTFKSQDSKAYMEYSVRFNKAGEFERGFKYLNKAVELDPLKHLGYRGWIRLRKLRDYDKALTDFNQLDSLTPNVVDAPWGEDIDFLRGECFFGQGQYLKAIEAFNRGIQNHGEGWVDIQTFVYLGLCEYELGNFKKAILEFERALRQSENTCEAHFGMARTYEKLEQKSKAIESARLAEENIGYRREDNYNEFLNEVYLSEIQEFREQLLK